MQDRLDFTSSCILRSSKTNETRRKTRRGNWQRRHRVHTDKWSIWELNRSQRKCCRNRLSRTRVSSQGDSKRAGSRTWKGRSGRRGSRGIPRLERPWVSWRMLTAGRRKMCSRMRGSSSRGKWASRKRRRRRRLRRPSSASSCEQLIKHY